MSDLTGLLLRATHTHLFPGARGSYAGEWRDGACELEFSDGVRVVVELWGDRLRVPAYVTAAGTEIAVKSWTLTGADGEFRVRGRSA